MSDKKVKVNIEINDEVAQGIYSNLAVITHSTSEFFLDFIRVMPTTPKAHVKSRIILTPENAKRLLKALQENVAKYEKTNGEITQSNNKNPVIPMNFGGTTAEA